MEEISFNNFRKNPVLYILFLPIIALIYLHISNKSLYEERVAECDKEKLELKIENKELIVENKELVKLLIQKQTLDSLKR